MFDLKEFTKIGNVHKPHGIHGELKFSYLPGTMSEEKDYDFFYLQEDGYLVPYKTEYVDFLSDEFGYVKFEDMDASEDAAVVSNTPFYLKNISVERLQDIPLSELVIGFTVYDQFDKKIGLVKNFLDIPQNPVLEVNNVLSEVLLPFHDSLIINFDAENKCVTLHVPEGLV